MSFILRQAQHERGRIEIIGEVPLVPRLSKHESLFFSGVLDKEKRIRAAHSTDCL
jgi:hypothetical protein